MECERLLSAWRRQRARLPDQRSRRRVEGEALARLLALGYGG
jgi:hypothetical protein